ncbi:MAG: DUF4190 domain-containing protein [Candidatus Saccharimonadales bacterium]
MEQDASPQQNMYGGQMPAQEIDDGTKTLGILSIVFAFLASFIGLILAIVGTSKAKRILKETGRPAQGAGYLQAGLICSIVMMSLWLVGIILSVVAVIAVINVASNEINWNEMGDYDYGYVALDDCDGESCAKIIVGDWDCYDGTSSITGYQYDDEGNIIGHDGSKQNPEIIRRYEFGTRLIYAYDVNNETDNNLRGSYFSELYEKEANGKFEYELTVKFTEFMSGGESLDNYVGAEATWNVVVDPEDRYTIGIGMGSSAYECRRAD